MRIRLTTEGALQRIMFVISEGVDTITMDFELGWESTQMSTKSRETWKWWNRWTFERVQTSKSPRSGPISGQISGACSLWTVQNRSFFNSQAILRDWLANEHVEWRDDDLSSYSSGPISRDYRCSSAHARHQKSLNFANCFLAPVAKRVCVMTILNSLPKNQTDFEVRVLHRKGIFRALAEVSRLFPHRSFCVPTPVNFKEILRNVMLSTSFRRN